MLVFTGLALALAGDALQLDSQRLDFRFIGENPHAPKLFDRFLYLFRAKSGGGFVMLIVICLRSHNRLAFLLFFFYSLALIVFG